MGGGDGLEQVLPSIADMATLYLGTQGWSYKDWEDVFYPPGTRPGDYLAYYATQFDAVELDTTFYGTPSASRVDTWYRATPGNFQFTAKMPRDITHDRQLEGVDEEVAAFLHSVGRLEDKLGAILIQLPPDLTAEARPRLAHLVKTLPHDLHFAVEFRHRSWLTDETADLLRAHGIAWTIIDLSFMRTTIEVTADFSYVRWLGNRRQIQQMDRVQIDRTEDIERWAGTLETITSRVERLYGFFNNHYAGHSPANVRQLRNLLGLPSGSTTPQQPQQGSLL